MQRYHLNSDQQAPFIADLQVIGQRMLAITFDSPETDQQAIRHHAYLRGRFDCLKAILEDNFPEPETQPQE